ncbi:alpha/beta fold hydrolase [Roseibacterium sp. SDUM158017]|uniref:alpha/beta fold hydrolase n=1 Tax=Roseicyclus salinarum TaxID=3036773 RepID=UPI002414F1EB|nr:alpha/beta fold hydrolase [Roseibacterium sp. SDUM158017]MDG4647838.1 alpha/beta fold hydrolase [Roseibacterium sp. SDUM158017]
MSDHQVFEIENFRLQRGITLPRAAIAYKTYGRLADDRSNVILYPTSYGAQHGDTEWLIGPGRVLDPDRWFIVIPNMFGNGLSTSPSNIGAPFERDRAPVFTHWDNVHAQRRLLQEVFGVERLALIYGWSMGAQQALHWGAIFPDRVARICAVCGSARTSVHNKVFLQGVRATLTGDPAWRGDHFAEHPVRGLRAMGRVYAGWAMSQAFYRERLYERAGYASLEDFIVRAWEGNFLRRDAHDLLASLETWMASDISDNPIHGGDLARALGAITARSIVMPSRTDLYFTPEDSALETAMMPNAEYRPIESIWGHRAGNPAQNPEDEAVLRGAVRDLLDGA